VSTTFLTAAPTVPRSCVAGASSKNISTMAPVITYHFLKFLNGFQVCFFFVFIFFFIFIVGFIIIFVIFVFIAVFFVGKTYFFFINFIFPKVMFGTFCHSFCFSLLCSFPSSYHCRWCHGTGLWMESGMNLWMSRFRFLHYCTLCQTYLNRNSMYVMCQQYTYYTNSILQSIVLNILYVYSLLYMKYVHQYT